MTTAAPISSVYPAQSVARDAWILTRRPASNPERAALDPWRPYAFLLEEEPDAAGTRVPVTTIFLTNRECPWRCVMCDLWRNTLTTATPPGAIPAQIEYALAELSRSSSAPSRDSKSCRPATGHRHSERSSPAAASERIEEPARPRPRAIKLYNAGSFFDPRAIPPQDHLAIAELVRSFDRVIVEAHPALIGDPVLRFRDLLDTSRPTGFAGARLQPCRNEPQNHPGLAAAGSLPENSRLEVAMGLETAHPGVLEKLNKRVTLAQFQAAAAFLRQHSIALRVFILVQPPFLDPRESLHWAQRSLDCAFDCGATAATLIPTRGGNGAMEALAASGDFTPPALATLEDAVEYGLQQGRGRIFSDLWDLPRATDCRACRDARVERLRSMNLTQTIAPRIPCSFCEGRS